ncbi:MAG: hypothetical protein V3V81_05515 [Candidatus Bathyarchaeia archaeon]|jgi:3-methyladenine DNA glycosylase AlkD
MISVEEVLNMLKALTKPERLVGVARYGIVVKRRMDVSVPDMHKIAKDIGKNHKFTLEL